MANKEEFKAFVKDNPKLVKYVNSGEMTWQKFYDMFDLYGKDNSVWDKYLVGGVSSVAAVDALSWIKNIDVDAFQNGINSLQRVVGLLQDFSIKDDKPKEEYKPRPLYKHFED